MTLIHVKYYYNDKTKDDKKGRAIWNAWERTEFTEGFRKKSQGKITLKRSRSGWETNFKMDFTETEKFDVDLLFGSKQERQAVCCEHGSQTSSCTKSGEKFLMSLYT